MEAIDSAVDPLREFAKDSVRLVKRCHKPDRKEFTKDLFRSFIEVEKRCKSGRKQFIRFLLAYVRNEKGCHLPVLAHLNVHTLTAKWI
ncbi:hypothetical protein MKW98_017987 [Papaver atlanticum]|uniref:Uncharacterized protein n=1 Tax=Papaver atlanticum TaxID=357466 RepID=A0AAD4TC89_9MAGN|nr:hypothetical protein MKW98_017987 [Papaver atlanticum]